MANKRYQKKGSKPAPATGHGGDGLGISPRMGTAAWPGLPGKTQPRSRARGERVLKQHAKSEGIEA